MLSLLKKPFEKETLDDWAKLSVDLSKVSIVAMPVVIYGNFGIIEKVINLLLLAFASYMMLCSGRLFRRMKQGE